MKKEKRVTQVTPIIFINIPISRDEDDVIGMNSSVDSIKHAIEQNAKMIGIIADYGSGKSSLTETLSKDKKRFGKAITINMWDSLSKESNTGKSSTDIIDTLTKSFLFQLASGISDSVAKHVNRRLSKNYNIISFSVSSRAFWGWALLAAFLYSISSLTSGIEIDTINDFITAFRSNIGTNDLRLWSSIIKHSSPLFFTIGIVSVIFGARNTSIAFSHWKAQNAREPNVNDIFEVYADLHKRLTRHRWSFSRSQRRLVIIEDLDRIDDKKLVVGFLKEIYRFNSLSQKTSKNDPVFAISVKPECTLKEDGERGQDISAIPNENSVYAKLFDYSITLKPIHHNDYGNILLKIIGDKSTNKEALQNILEEKDKISDTLPPSFSWLQKGNNLTIRQLKDRLNHAVYLLVNLKNKNYENQSYISFSSCAAVAYLELQYPKQYSQLIKMEDEFSKLVQDSFQIRNTLDLANKKTDMGKVVNDFLQNNEIDSQAMKDDIVNMLIEGDISDDFRMYFYSFPKGSYIMNGDERDISNLLLFPRDYPMDDQINEKIDRIVNNKKEHSIEKIVKRIANDNQKEFFPSVIIKNEFLFSSGYRKNPDKIISTVNNLTPWEDKKTKDSQDVLAQLFNYPFEDMKSFWIAYAESLYNKIVDFNDDRKLEIRQCIVEIFGDKSSVFKKLFIRQTPDSKVMPLITEDEFKAISNINIAITLIDDELLNKNNIDYISSFINMNKLEVVTFERARQIYISAKTALPDTPLWLHLINFLKINETTDIELFTYALSSYSNESFDRKKVTEYLNSLPANEIPLEYCAQIDLAIIDGNLSDEILHLLYDNEFFTALLSAVSKMNKTDFVDFRVKKDQENIMSACNRILSYDSKLIPKIRLEIITQLRKEEPAEEIPDIYLDLFFSNYPIISLEEINEFNSVSIMLQYLNRELLTTSNCSEIVAFINENSVKDECITYFQFLFSKEYSDEYKDDSVVLKIVESLDYNKIGFCDLDADGRDRALEYLAEQIDLSNSQVANDFMVRSNCLTPELEKAVILSGETQIYIDTINTIDSPTHYTIEWITNNDVSFPLSPRLLEAMLDNKQEAKYLVGKVLSEKEFEFPYSKVSEGTVLTQYKINSPIWRSIKDDQRLVNYIIQNKHYESFNEAEFPEVLRPLYNGKQTIMFVKFLFSKVSNEEKIFYLASMGEILNAENSIDIARYLTEEANVILLKDKELFCKVRERLWEDVPNRIGYKSSFTRKRNEKFPTDKV